MYCFINIFFFFIFFIILNAPLVWLAGYGVRNGKPPRKGRQQQPPASAETDPGQGHRPLKYLPMWVTTQLCSILHIFMWHSLRLLGQIRQSLLIKRIFFFVKRYSWAINRQRNTTFLVVVTYIQLLIWIYFNKSGLFDSLLGW